MELFFISFLVTLVIVLLSAILQTFFPDVFSEKFQTNASAITLAFLGITSSILLLMIFLKARIREGFEDTAYLNRWNAMVSETRVSDVCNLYTEIYMKIMLIEKGAPPEAVKSDAQAREATDKQFSAVMTLPPISCSLFQEIESNKNNIDSLFVDFQKLPDTFFAQVIETAIGCRSLLIQQLNTVEESERKRREGFEDFPLCDEATAKERKAYKEQKELSQQAKQCLLVEEIPPEAKAKVLQKKMDAMEKAFNRYRAVSSVKDSIQKILDDAMYFKGQLDKKKQEAENMSNKYNLK